MNVFKRGNLVKTNDNNMFVVDTVSQDNMANVYWINAVIDDKVNGLKLEYTTLKEHIPTDYLKHVDLDDIIEYIIKNDITVNLYMHIIGVNTVIPIQNAIHRNYEKIDFNVIANGRDLTFEIKGKNNTSSTAVINIVYDGELTYNININKEENKMTQKEAMLTRVANMTDAEVQNLAKLLETKTDELGKTLLPQSHPELEKVYANPTKQTIVLKWTDGTTTKANCDEADNFDLEKGVAVAMAKKYFTFNEIDRYTKWTEKIYGKELGKLITYQPKDIVNITFEDGETIEAVIKEIKPKSISAEVLNGNPETTTYAGMKLEIPFSRLSKIKIERVGNAEAYIKSKMTTIDTILNETMEIEKEKQETKTRQNNRKKTDK